jgi:uncharacterized protein
MSSDPNIPLENFPAQPGPPQLEQMPAQTEKPPAENPVFSGWDVLLIVSVTFVLPFLFLFASAMIAKKYFYSGLSFMDVGQKPIIALIAEFTAYVAVLAFMVMLIEGKYRISFFKAIGWNAPLRWWNLAGLGVVLLFAIQGLGHFLPVPKEVPFDKFFENARDAYLTSIFAISFGPFMEEVLFRGFLYPVLARRIGMIASILITSILFGLVHGAQLSFSWAPVLMISIVGIVLTTVRALKKSVASSLIVHIAYNFTLTSLTYIGTGGFKHLEKLTQ